MKTTTKAIFSLGLISFLTLGAMSQNAFAADAKSSITPQANPTTKTTTNPQLNHQTPGSTKKPKSGNIGNTKKPKSGNTGNTKKPKSGNTGKTRK